MVKKTDYHTHTSHSFDGANSMEEMIEAAIGEGVSEIAFTDHVDVAIVCPLYQPPQDFAAYKAEFDGLREKYAGKIELVYGVEISLFKDASDGIGEFLDRDFEFIIGSVHDLTVGDVYSPEFCGERGKKEIYRLYFEEMLENVKNVKNIDVLGHMDYIERYADCGKADKTADYSDFMEIIDEIFKIIIKERKGIEINTSGFRYGLGHTHPCGRILRRYRELGGEIITIGSDAHCVEHVGAGFDDAVEALRAAGFKAYSVYRGRKPRMVDLS